jgi:glutathione S-transferase
MRADEPPRLWHLAVSNFNEKARWALDYKRVPHRRRAMEPGPHMAVALALTGRSITFPVLEVGGRRAVGGSSAIIAELERRYPQRPLYPADPEARRRALELEAHFDQNYGEHVRCVGFWELFKEPKYLGLGEAQGKVFAALTGLRFSIDEESAARSIVKVREGLDLIEETLGDGDHLVGDEFTVADLAACALTGPVLRPPELPYGFAKMQIPESLRRISDEIRERPAGRWMLRTYSRYRYPSPEQAAREQRRPAAAGFVRVA